MKNIPIVILYLLLFILYNCSDSITNPAYPFNLLDTVEIKYKETVYNEIENISLTFESLISDSRCPIGGVCVWEGDAEIALNFAKQNSNIKFSLHTNKKFIIDTTLFGYNIKLVSVNPHPHIDSTYTAEQYKVGIVVAKE